MAARLSKEILLLRATPAEGFELTDATDVFNWSGTLTSPASSPYGGKKFRIQLQFPETYPFKPPTVQFLDRVVPVHPHIHPASEDSPGGAVCLRLLTSEGWSATTKVGHVITELRTMLLSLDA
jgi:ubiquitin-protein ligase